MLIRMILIDDLFAIYISFCIAMRALLTNAFQQYLNKRETIDNLKNYLFAIFLH